MNYPMYNPGNFYLQDLQNRREMLDNQIKQYQQQNQYQMQQPVPQVTQNFQLAPTQSNSEIDAKYAENTDEVKNTLTLKNTFFINKDNSMLWFKNVAGDIKKYSLIEIVELDPKDKEIAELKQQIANMQNIITQNESQNKTQNQIISSENKFDKKNNRKEG